VTETTNAPIALDVHLCKQRRVIRVEFRGPQAEDFALNYIERKSTTCDFSEREDEPIDYDLHPRLYRKLNPLCEHGLSAWLCAGPQHYPYDEEERAHYGY
jgi:hypothetical protein